MHVQHVTKGLGQQHKSAFKQPSASQSQLSMEPVTTPHHVETNKANEAQNTKQGKQGKARQTSSMYMVGVLADLAMGGPSDPDLPTEVRLCKGR